MDWIDARQGPRKCPGRVVTKVKDVLSAWLVRTVLPSSRGQRTSYESEDLVTSMHVPPLHMERERVGSGAGLQERHGAESGVTEIRRGPEVPLADVAMRNGALTGRGDRLALDDGGDEFGAEPVGAALAALAAARGGVP